MFVCAFQAKAADLCLNDFYVSAGYGVFSGYNIQVGYRPLNVENGFFKSFGVRLDLNKFSNYKVPFVFWDGNFTVDIKDRPVNFHLAEDNVREFHESAGILIDYYLSPSSGFRFTGGLYTQKSKATSSKAAKFDVDIDAAAGMYWKRCWAPYLGVGYDHLIWSNLSFTSDFGMMYVGSPSVKLDVDGVPSLTPEEMDNARAGFKDKVSFIQYYPILRVGLSWRF